MKINRICKVCGGGFIAIKATQYFCQRKCFKRDFYQRIKARLQDKQQNPTYPSKECNFCLQKSKLDFDPLDNPKRFDAWGCPFCGATNKLIWENQNNPNSYQVISQILVSLQFTAVSVMQNSFASTYQTYKIPISRLEQGNPSIVVMPCEKINIVDIQRNN